MIDVDGFDPFVTRTRTAEITGDGYECNDIEFRDSRRTLRLVPLPSLIRVGEVPEGVGKYRVLGRKDCSSEQIYSVPPGPRMFN